MTERRRDLSGFGVPGPPPGPSEARRKPQPPPPPPPRDHSTRPSVSTPVRRTMGLDKKRITLSLPTTVATRLRRVADSEDRYFLDIILDSFVAHAEAVDSDLAGRGQAPSRRAAGRTQIPLNILPEDLGVVDKRAKALGLNRSAYVAELLTRSLL